MEKVIVLLIFSLIVTASAHVPLESKEIAMSIITDWDSYKQTLNAVSDLGIQVDILPAADDEGIKSNLNKELDKGAFVLVVGHTNAVKEFLEEKGLSAVLVRPGRDTAIGKDGDDVRIVVVENEDIRIGIAKMLSIMMAGCSESNYSSTASILPLSMLILGVILGLGAGVYLKNRNHLHL